MGEHQSAAPAATMPQPVELVLAPAGEFVLRDEILARVSVPANDAEVVAEGLNKLRSPEELQRGFTWRPARSLPDQGHYCPSCGARTCWCGVRRLISRSEEIASW